MQLLIVLVAAIVIWWLYSQFTSWVASQKNHVDSNTSIRPNRRSAVTERAEPSSEYQPWLSKAVEHKQNKEFDEALRCLDEAYKACAEYHIQTVHDHYLRLPYYLQLAGKSDEGWKKLNEFNLGLFPYRGDAPTGSERDIRLRLKVTLKMASFLNKEKRLKEALIHTTVSAYLRNAIELKMLEDNWIKKEAVTNMDEELRKAVKKAKLDESLADRLCMFIKMEINKGKQELYVLSRVPDVMREARSLISG